MNFLLDHNWRIGVETPNPNLWEKKTHSSEKTQLDYKCILYKYIYIYTYLHLFIYLYMLYIYI